MIQSLAALLPREACLPSASPLGQDVQAAPGRYPAVSRLDYNVICVDNTQLSRPTV